MSKMALPSEKAAVPTPGRTARLRGRELFKQGKGDEAIEAFTEALRFNQTDVGALTSRAHCYLDRSQGHDLDLAIADFSEVTRVYPKPMPFCARASIYQRKGETDLAIADYTEAIRLDPTVRIAYSNRGNLYRHKEEDDLAIVDFTEALRLDSTGSDVFFQRGLSYAMTGKYDSSLSDFAEGIRLDPRKAGGFVGRGKTYEIMGEPDLAFADYSRAIRLADPDDPELGDAFFHRGLLLCVKRKLTAAIADFTQAIRLSKVSTLGSEYCPLAFAYRGQCHRQIGKGVLAVADFTKAVRLDPELGDACLKLGDFYMGDVDLAQAGMSGFGSAGKKRHFNLRREEANSAFADLMREEQFESRKTRNRKKGRGNRKNKKKNNKNKRGRGKPAGSAKKGRRNRKRRNGRKGTKNAFRGRIATAPPASASEATRKAQASADDVHRQVRKSAPAPTWKSKLLAAEKSDDGSVGRKKIALKKKQAFKEAAAKEEVALAATESEESSLLQSAKKMKPAPASSSAGTCLPCRSVQKIELPLLPKSSLALDLTFKDESDAMLKIQQFDEDAAARQTEVGLIHARVAVLLGEIKRLENAKKIVEIRRNDMLRAKEKRGVEEESKVCVVCLEATRAIVLLPCRHLCLCKSCSEAVQSCPLCREKIKSRMSVFL